MTPTSPARQGGFTIYEVVIVTALAALALSATTAIFGSNLKMVDDSRARQRAEAAHRRNMVAIARILRTVDVQTLSGFDANGVSTNPSFARVTGADMDDLTYTGDEQLAWRQTPHEVDGVSSPGAVYLIRNGQLTLVADRIPQGGFRVRRDGRNLIVTLTTYYVTSTSRLVYRTTDSVVSVRN